MTTPLRAAVRLLLALTVTVGALGACDSDRRAISRDDLPEVPTTPDHVIVIDETGFDISSLEIETNDLLRFRITDGQHRITATSELVTLLDTGLLYAGETTDMILDVADTYEFSVDDGEPTLTVVVTRPEPRKG